MALERLYRTNVFLGLAEPEAFADRNAPTADELNDAVATINWTGGLVHNITCALWEDETEFTLGDPDTDTGLTYCSEAGIESPTFDNPTVTYTALRDLNRLNAATAATANGVFNQAFELLAWPDREFIAVKRVGFDSDVPFAVGQDVRLVQIRTGVPTDVGSGTDNTRIQNQFLAQSWLNWNYRITA